MDGSLADYEKAIELKPSLPSAFLGRGYFRYQKRDFDGALADFVKYELTKPISLMQVNPLVLVQLRTVGRCVVRLPEELFDLDGPGHYFRRIKTVAVSIPCVTGPYASVNCTLTLLKSSLRTSSVLRDGAYARENAEDHRFHDYFGSLQSIVTNLPDERYLHFR